MLEFKLFDIILKTNINILCILLDGINKGSILNRSDVIHEILPDASDFTFPPRLLNITHHLSTSHSQHISILFP